MKECADMNAGTQSVDKDKHFQIFFPHFKQYFESSSLYLTPSTHSSASKSAFKHPDIITPWFGAFPESPLV